MNPVDAGEALEDVFCAAIDIDQDWRGLPIAVGLLLIARQMIQSHLASGEAPLSPRETKAVKFYAAKWATV